MVRTIYFSARNNLNKFHKQIVKWTTGSWEALKRDASTACKFEAMVKDNKASIGTMPLGEQQLKARDLPYAETSAWKVQIGMPQWKSLLYRERQKAEVRNERMERGYPVFCFYFLLVPGKKHAHESQSHINTNCVQQKLQPNWWTACFVFRSNDRYGANALHCWAL